MRYFLLLFLRAYRHCVSPLMPPMCRFEPTCSRYMSTAIERYGPARGLLLGVKRLIHCHPMNPGGWDPVP